ARTSRRIGRHLEFSGGAWRELEDTRIAPGDALELKVAWTDGRTADATHARVRIEVAPDDYYEGFYRTKLRGQLPAEERALFVDALRRAQANHYRAFERLYPIR